MTNVEDKINAALALKGKAPSGDAIVNECLGIMTLLLEKNAAYGNSALYPINIFSKLGAEDQIDVRIDDKLNRMKKGFEYRDEDTIKDLVGYLILKLVHRSQDNYDELKRHLGAVY